jgi:uncharacterized protein (DUF2235 family)
MARNIVVLCDGTNNSLIEPITNIGHLSKVADIGNPEVQLPYYDAGVGVQADSRMRTRIGSKVSQWLGAAFGAGLVANVHAAYRFLIENRQEGDRVFMFGFSRGAYTVRVLAGLLENYGLLNRECEQNSEQVVKAFQDLYKTDAGKQQRETERDQMRTQWSQPCPVHFIGVFDTVSSLGWAWNPQTFSNTAFMPQVKILRHAMALDERRAKFRTNRVHLIDGYDSKQMWFAGVHSDVGGGYQAPDNKLSRVPLRWMLGEAAAAGMQVNAGIARGLDLDATYLQDEQAGQNESLSGAWHALEYLSLPHRTEVSPGMWETGKRRYRGAGWRNIPSTFIAHESLQRRKTPVKNVNWKDALTKITFGK